MKRTSGCSIVCFCRLRYRLCFAAHICIIFFPVVAYRLCTFFMQQQQEALFARPYKYMELHVLQKRPSSIHKLFILESGNLERKDGRKNIKKTALTSLNSICIRDNPDWWSAFVYTATLSAFTELGIARPTNWTTLHPSQIVCNSVPLNNGNNED